MLRKNKVVGILIMVIFLLTCLSPLALASQMDDINGHWAEAQIKDMVNQGIISGYPDGSFKPEGKITRAEFASLLVKGFNLPTGGGKIFSDTANHWAKNSIAVANVAGIVNGYSDTVFGPNDPITREQMAVMVVKATGLSGDVNARTFADDNSISLWAGDAVAIAAEKNIITGYPDNTFRPKGNATRAEAAVVLNKGITLVQAPAETKPVAEDLSFIDKLGTYGPTVGSKIVAGNVIVNVPGVTLQNLIIQGDLTIAKGVGSGDVNLNNITVKGKTYIRGGGKDSIHIKGGQYNDIIIEKTATGAVRIVATDSSGLRVVIADNADGEKIILEGDFKNITVKADNVNIATQGNATIDGFRVESGLDDVKIELSQGSTVSEMVLNSTVSVKGQGTVKEASGSKAKESSFATTPDKITAPPAGGGGGGGSTTPQLSISPTTYSINKHNVTDIPINITWGSAAKVAGITGSALGGAFTATLTEGAEYVVKDYGNGTGLLTIKSSLTKLLPVPMAAIPEGTELTLTIKFDKGEKDFAIKVVGGAITVTGLTIKTPPNKLIYTAGDTLDLTGLAVTCAKSDSSSEEVALADFAAKGITASPDNGTVLATTDTEVTITHTVSGKSVKQAITVVPAPVPMKIITNIPEFTVGEPQTFTIGTAANSDTGKLVRAHFTLPEGATLEYQEGEVGPWLPLTVVFGPSTGFPLGDITTTFRGTFAKAGTFTVKVEFKQVSDGAVLGSKVITVEVKVPEVSVYDFELTGADQEQFAGTLLEGSVIDGQNGVDTTGLTPVRVTLKAAIINQLGYANVKVLAPEVEQIGGSGGKLQFWAYSAADTKWFDAGVYGWGSGFTITPDYNVTTPVYVLADTAGTYKITFKLADLNSGNATIAEKIVTITVLAPGVRETSGVLPGTSQAIVDEQAFAFGFKSVTGNLQELELDIYLGANTGANRNYPNHLGVNLPAGKEAVEQWVDQVVTNYSSMPAKFQTLLAAAGYNSGQAEADNKSNLKSRIFYTDGEKGAGTWTVTLDTAVLNEAKIEFLVAVRDDKGFQWGNNNYVAYPSDVNAFLYNVTLPQTSLTMSVDNLNAAAGEEFTMPVTVTGIVATGDKNHLVRFYGVIPNLSADKIVLTDIVGGKPEVITNATERIYAGASDEDMVLAWGPAGGFPISAVDYSGDGATTNFKAQITAAGTYTVRFVFYDLTGSKQINGANEMAAITVG